MFDKKKSELLRLLVISSLLVLTIGVIVVLSANNPTSSIVTTPQYINASANHTLNFTITNPAGSATISAVRVQRAAGFTSIDCGVNLPAGWSCDDTSSALQIDFAGGSIAAGSTTPFMINGLAPTTSGNQTFIITPYEGSIADGTQNTTLNPVNVTVTVDAEPPRIGAINVSDGTRVLNGSGGSGTAMWVDGSALVFNVSISDLLAGVNAASVYYNFSNYSLQPVSTFPHPTVAASYDSAVLALAAAGNANEYTATIPADRLVNGTIVYFTIAANDTVQNINITNSTASQTAATASFNVSVDSAAPLLYTPNFTDNVDAADDNITTSSTIHNFTVIADDHGGSGVSRVEFAVNISNSLQYINMSQGGANMWHYNGTLQDLGVPSGDGNYTIWFRAYDNVSNENSSVTTLNVLVDDPDFVVTAQSNTTSNFTTSNATQINITATVNANLNLSLGNVTIHGPDSFRWNMTLVSQTAQWGSVGAAGDITYQSTWASSSNIGASTLNRTFSNLSDLGCGVQGIGEGVADDGEECTLQITWSDIFGRENSTNITITVDNVIPSVTNISNNATSQSVQVVRTGTVMNFTVNANNNVLNVTIHNSTLGGYTSNTSFLTSIGGGNYTITITPDYFCPTDGRCTINFTTVDLAFNLGTNSTSGIGIGTNSTHATSFFVDNLAPDVKDFAINGSTDQIETVIGTGASRIVRSNLALNITVNVQDAVTNVTQVNLGNATLRNMTNYDTALQANYSNVSDLAAYGCPTNVEGVQCTLALTAADNVTIDGTSNTNSSVNLTFEIDDLTPRVNFSASLSQGVGYNVTSVNTVILFLANITDANLPDFNVSIGSGTSVKLNKTVASTSNTTSIIWNGSYSLNDLGCSSDGDCAITLTANDSAGNVNDSETITVTADSAVPNVTAMSTGVTFASSKPTFYVNTSANAQCRYQNSATGSANNYYSMSSQFNNDGTINNSFQPADDLIDDDYNYYISCVDVAGGNTFLSTAANPITYAFAVDTRSLWNITIGATGTNGVNQDYFSQANKFYKFSLANTNVLATTAVSTDYNVTNVLSSIVGDGSVSAGNNNLSVIFAYNRTGDTWTSYVPGRASNDFTNFTTDTMDYYINLSAANERLEIN